MTKPARSVAVVIPANVSRDVVKGLNARSVVSLSIEISRWQVYGSLKPTSVFHFLFYVSQSGAID